MRTLSFALALVVLVACGRSDRRDAPAGYDVAPTALNAQQGPEPIVVRVPRRGGIARAFRYPRLDSAIWSSPGAVPGMEQLLGFDPEAGSLAYVDSRGYPERLDLRFGGATRATRTKLHDLASADGSAIYGVTDKGVVQRLTPEGSWSWTPPLPARDVYPQPDGSLLVLSDRGDSTRVWHLYPPETRIADSAAVPRVVRATRTQVGDRLYFTGSEGLIGLRGRDLHEVPAIDISGQILGFVPTPSGDRLFVLTDSGRTIRVVDRYAEKATDRIALPATASALRIDPYGRYLLARRAEKDSAFVVAIANAKVMGEVATDWRPDLPFVTPDGLVALAQGKDVVLANGTTLAPERTVRGGAADAWALVFWDGFRPRAAELDQPVTFPGQDTVTDSSRLAAPDSLQPRSDSTASAFPGSPSPGGPVGAPPAPGDTTRAPAPRRGGYVVQFAALLSEERAREMAATISVEGETAHVSTSVRLSQPIYRVVLGPYPTRAEADRMGRASGRSYWIYEGNP